MSGVQPMRVSRLTLEGQHARLVPLELEHAEELSAVADDPEIWRYLPYDPCPGLSLQAMRGWIEKSYAEEASGYSVRFAIVECAGGRAIGSTRYMDIQPNHYGLEIGGTWLGRAYRRTPINTECKFLLLSHAFESLGAIRVQLKTDLRNTNSQRAIERLGAVREGILRKQMIMPDGYRRSSVMYSILDDEWPLVRQRLLDLLHRPR